MLILSKTHTSSREAATTCGASTDFAKSAAVVDISSSSGDSKLSRRSGSLGLKVTNLVTLVEPYLNECEADFAPESNRRLIIVGSEI